MTGSFFFIFSVLMRLKGASGVVGCPISTENTKKTCEAQRGEWHGGSELRKRFRRASQQLKASYASTLVA
jgi:hypothetical protein